LQRLRIGLPSFEMADASQGVAHLVYGTEGVCRGGIHHGQQGESVGYHSPP
jgi:hypothetical protein